MAGYFEQHDPLFFAPHLSVIFPTTGLKIEGLPTQSKISAVLSKAARSKLSFDQEVPVDKYVLNKDTAKTYADLFQRQTEREPKIPWILGPAGMLPVVGMPISLTTSILDLLIRRLADSGDSGGSGGWVSASQMVVLMAEGGAFIKTWSLERHPQQGELLRTMVSYNVTVGSENRMHGIYSSKHALVVRG